jgi:hypothetical protein
MFIRDLHMHTAGYGRELNVTAAPMAINDFEEAPAHSEGTDPSPVATLSTPEKESFTPSDELDSERSSLASGSISAQDMKKAFVNAVESQSPVKADDSPCAGAISEAVPQAVNLHNQEATGGVPRVEVGVNGALLMKDDESEKKPGGGQPAVESNRKEVTPFTYSQRNAMNVDDVERLENDKRFISIPLIKPVLPSEHLVPSVDAQVEAYRQRRGQDPPPQVVKAIENAEKSLRGDKEAIVQNVRNILDMTREKFTENYVKKYKEEHNGKEPTEQEVKQAHHEAFLKAQTQARYGWGASAGIDPSKIDKVFFDTPVPEGYDGKTPLVDGPVMRMLRSFPDLMDVGGYKGVSINHLLSGIQYNNTEADSGTGLTKHTLGEGVNSHTAEELKTSGFFGEWHREEKGHAGIWAGESGELGKAFLQDPSEALRSFLEHPDNYVHPSWLQSNVAHILATVGGSLHKVAPEFVNFMTLNDLKNTITAIPGRLQKMATE